MNINNYGALNNYDGEPPDNENTTIVSFASISSVFHKNWRNTAIFLSSLIMIFTLPVLITTNFHPNQLSTNSAASVPIISIPSIATTPVIELLIPPTTFIPGIITPGLSTTYQPTTLEPTAYPTYLDVDDDAYNNYYDKFDLRFTSNRDSYPTLSYFLPNASDIYSYKFLHPYTGVVEPYATMWLNITYTNFDATDFYYQYEICNTNGGKCSNGFVHNTSFSYECDPLTTNFTVSIYEYSAIDDNKSGKTSDGYLLCMYVRREFRALTSEDLTKTMDAMFVMWDVEEEKGQSLYGEKYHNYAYLLEFHYFNAAWIDADHVHEGLGFAAQHIKMSNIFEKSMQSVEPSISLPYWDYTIETAYGIDVWDSPMFNENTFGTLSMPNDMTWGWLYESNSIDDARISDGRWANMLADYNDKYEDLYMAYGFMRAPWNLNPSKYITRFVSVDKSLPMCDSHYTMLEYSSIVDFLHQIPYAPHASTHGVIGGIFGCDAMDSLRDSGYILSDEGQQNLCKNWIFYLKEFYRSNILIPPDDCESTNSKGEYSVEKTDLSCQYVCNTDNMDMLMLMLKHSILNSDYDCIPVDDMPTEGWNAWVDFICDGDGSKIFGGDHLESASPADPSFWPIHPTSERLMQAKYMSGGFTTDTWPTDASSDYVCNKVSCYDSNADNFIVSEDCCYGHYQYDRMFDAPNNDRTTFVGPTNNEIHELTNPTKSYYGMPYIYDNFDWSHCKETGLDFDELLTGLYNKAATYEVVQSDSEKGW